MRDKIRKKPVFTRKALVNITDIPCRHPDCKETVRYRILYYLNGFSYYLMVCKEHRDWAEKLARKFEEVLISDQDKRITLVPDREK